MFFEIWELILIIIALIIVYFKGKQSSEKVIREYDFESRRQEEEVRIKAYKDQLKKQLKQVEEVLNERNPSTTLPPKADRQWMSISRPAPSPLLSS